MWNHLRVAFFDQRADFPFKLVTFDRIAIVLAGFGLAEIIGIAFAQLATCEGRAQGHVAAAAGDNAVQREVFADIGALGCFGGARAMHPWTFVEDLLRDDGLMLILRFKTAADIEHSNRTCFEFRRASSGR